MILENQERRKSRFPCLTTNDKLKKKKFQDIVQEKCFPRQAIKYIKMIWINKKLNKDYMSKFS